MEYDALREALKGALVESRRDTKALGHDWDVADALDAVAPVVWEAMSR